MTENKGEAKSIREPMKRQGDKIKPDRSAENESSQVDKSQKSILVPEKQGGIAGP
jgi:hypothetical protein